ncbi:SDR family NAD(P)-dependent oxidoreductase [Hymenobacter weizhouensis]|uniref:SDR family NAD(P)-dependent oxidoreductase n=1 Tax=Hymenobacter sp. YIM 151500-1 TaxID=2987689 RepID=UPI0022265673|nr:SDR family oxidoreductase [Hymenobacter sp. YIM 151500-1]UYZ63692.1 SDR family oxidoreductase [Hymenobacter sp. YIM 151500-1]
MTASPTYALITGATSGIGRELARLFAQDRYNLIIVARHQQELDHTAAEFREQYGVEVVPLAQDLFRREAPFELVAEVKRRGLQVEALVNNAGQGQYGEFVDTDLNRELDIIQLNIGAYVVLTKHFLQEMVARGSGKILQVSSIGGELPGPLQAVYHGTKAFVTSFTAAIREETKDRGVTITALLPGVTDTDFFNKADMTEAKMVKEGHRADPVDVAKDGYEALMAGKDKIVSGFLNKVQVAISNVVPDNLVAAGLHQMVKPADEDK